MSEAKFKVVYRFDFGTTADMLEHIPGIVNQIEGELKTLMVTTENTHVDAQKEYNSIEDAVAAIEAVMGYQNTVKVDWQIQYST